MKLVADTSIFLAVALEEPEKKQLISVTVGAILVVPEILHFEIANALSCMNKKAKLNQQEIKTVYDIATSIAVMQKHIDIKKALQIALDYSIYAYDSYFLELCLETNLPLLTLDAKMKKIAKKLNIKIVEI